MKYNKNSEDPPCGRLGVSCRHGLQGSSGPVWQACMAGLLSA